MHTPDAYQEHQIHKLIEHGIYQKKANVKAMLCCYRKSVQCNSKDRDREQQVINSKYFLFIY